LDSVVEVDVAPVLLRLQIQVLEQLDESLVELSEFDIGRTVLNLSLQNVNVFILDSNQLPFLDEFSVLFFELGVDLSQGISVFLLL